jgi:hypothetical protein
MLFKDDETDRIQGTLMIGTGTQHCGLAVGRETGLNSSANKDKWGFVTKSRDGCHRWKISRRKHQT